MPLTNTTINTISVLILLLFIQSEANSDFIQTKNSQFVLNGSTFLFNGFNSYWLVYVATQPNQMYKVSNVFREASEAHLTVCRTWGFNDGEDDHALQISPGVYNESVFQAFDFVISEAKKYGIRLILALSNNYHDFGGRPQYVKWARDAGVLINSDDDFYTNDIVKGYYKNHVKKILMRINTITGIVYRDDPTIMAWELINEPRCQVDLSGKTINGWVEDMATYVKSIDSNHLLAIGMEGFYGDMVPGRKQYNAHGYQVGTDFISNNLIKDIDFTTIHAYPDIWLSGQDNDAQMTFMRNWITIHWRDSTTIVRKPLVFSEFGLSKIDPGYNITVRDSFLNSVYSSIYDLARIGGNLGGGIVWQIMVDEMESYYDGYEIVLSQEPSTNSVITQQSDKMIALGHLVTIPFQKEINTREKNN